MKKSTLSWFLVIAMLAAMFSGVTMSAAAAESVEAGSRDLVVFTDDPEDPFDTPEDIDVYFVDGTDTEMPYIHCYASEDMDEYDETSEDLCYPGDPQVQPLGTEMSGHKFYKVTLNPGSVDRVMFGNGTGSFSESAEPGHTAALPFVLDAVDSPLDGNRFVVYSVRVENNVMLATKVDDVWPAPIQVLQEPTCTEAGSKGYIGLCTGAYAVAETIPALGHAWDEGTVLTPACHQWAGEKKFTCTRCSETRIDPIDRLPNPFVDVIEGVSYFFDPVMWALDHDPLITAGVDATHYGPDRPCAREQIVTFLWKAAGAPKPTATVSEFSDVHPGVYYYDAVLWAKETGVTSGMGDGTFGVGQPCTRAQAMTFLWVSQDRPAPTGGNPFTDVMDGAWYCDPIRWAVENHITAGMGDGTFGVAVTCTRGQIITFLYKAFTLPKE